METVKLTIRLPADDIAFVKRYAKDHGLSVTEVIDRYLRRMRALDQADLAPGVESLSGLLPGDIDLRTERDRYLNDKHGS